MRISGVVNWTMAASVLSVESITMKSHTEQTSLRDRGVIMRYERTEELSFLSKAFRHQRRLHELIPVMDRKTVVR